MKQSAVPDLAASRKALTAAEGKDGVPCLVKRDAQSLFVVVSLNK